MKNLFLKWNIRPYKNIDIFIIGVCNIVDGVLAVITLGFCYPWLHSKYVVWRTKKSIEIRARLEK